MAKPRSREPIKFPFRYESNGRTGRIKFWPKSGLYGTYFVYASNPVRNSFKTFDAACDYLDIEFSRLDTDKANSLSQYPINHDVKTYHELEQLLRERANGATLREVVEFFLAHHQHKRFKPKTVEECVTAFLKQERERNLSLGQVRSLEKHLGHFKKEFGTRKIHEISALEISEWLESHVDQRTHKKWGIKTRRNVRGSLVSLSLFAKDMLNAIPDVGATEFQKVRNPKKEDKGEVEIYTPAQLNKILLTAIDHDIDLIPALVVACWEGLRPDEFHAETTNRKPLQWDAFNWGDSILSVSGQKVRSKKTRPVPIFTVTEAWLKPFKELSGSMWNRTKSYTRRMHDLMVKAEVTGLYDGFRHSYASYRIRHLKGDLNKLAEEMGNSPAEIINSYKRNVSDKEADAWFSLKPPADYAKKIAIALALRKSSGTDLLRNQ